MIDMTCVLAKQKELSLAYRSIQTLLLGELKNDFFLPSSQLSHDFLHCCLCIIKIALQKNKPLEITPQQQSIKLKKNKLILNGLEDDARSAKRQKIEGNEIPCTEEKAQKKLTKVTRKNKLALDGSRGDSRPAKRQKTEGNDMPNTEEKNDDKKANSALQEKKILLLQSKLSDSLLQIIARLKKSSKTSAVSLPSEKSLVSANSANKLEDLSILRQKLNNVLQQDGEENNPKKIWAPSEMENLPSQSNQKMALKSHATKYGFDCFDVPGDGRCFFHAVHHQLNNLKLLDDLTSGNLVEKTTQHILDNVKAYQTIINDLDAFIIALQQNERWADHEVVMALSRALNLTMIIIRSDGALPTIIRQAKPVAAIVLGYEVGLHYQSLIKNNALMLDSGSDIDSLVNKADIDHFISDKAPANKPLQQAAASASMEIDSSVEVKTIAANLPPKSLENKAESKQVEAKLTEPEIYQALAKAIKDQDEEQIKQLIENGLDINAIIKIGGEEVSLIIAAIRYQLTNIIVYLIDRKVNITIKASDSNSKTLIQHAIFASNHYDKNKALLIVNTLQSAGLKFIFPLHEAAWRGDEKRFAEEFAASKNALLSVGSLGCSIIHYAVAGGHLPIVEWLFKKDETLLRQKTNQGWIALLIAVTKGLLALADRLLKEDNSLLEQQDKCDMIAFLVTAAKGYLAIVGQLFKEDSSHQQQDKDGWIAFLSAADNGHLSLVQWLCENDFVLIEEIKSALRNKHIKNDKVRTYLQESISHIGPLNIAEYVCPRTRELMKDPVMHDDGKTYERVAIENYLSTNKVPKENWNLLPNLTLKKAIHDYKEKNKKLQQMQEKLNKIKQERLHTSEQYESQNHEYQLKLSKAQTARVDLQTQLEQAEQAGAAQEIAHKNKIKELEAELANVTQTYTAFKEAKPRINFDARVVALLNQWRNLELAGQKARLDKSANLIKKVFSGMIKKRKLLAKASVYSDYQKDIKSVKQTASNLAKKGFFANSSPQAMQVEISTKPLTAQLSIKRQAALEHLFFFIKHQNNFKEKIQMQTYSIEENQQTQVQLIEQLQTFLK